MSIDIPAGGDQPLTLFNAVRVFELALTCGHLAIVRVAGWYPVSVGCCERLGGVWSDETFYPFHAEVEYVRLLDERHEPPHAVRPTLTVISRSPRTDDPVSAAFRWQESSAGRFPVRVGGPQAQPANR